MSQVPNVLDENARLAALQRYEILDTPPDPALDDVARLAAFCCQTPVAAINFIDGDRVWSKASVGLPTNTLPRSISLCTYTILNHELCIIPDTTLDPRVANNPMFGASAKVRFYAGVPLLTPEGNAIGTLCVMDLTPRTITPEQQNALQALARQVTTQLEAHRSVNELQREIAERQAAQEELRQSQQALSLFIQQTLFPVVSVDANFHITEWNPAAEKVFHYTRAEVLGRHPSGLLFPETYAQYIEESRQALHVNKQTAHGPAEITTRDGRTLLCEWYVTPLVDKAGEVIGFTVIAQDITESVRATQALQESEARFRTLFEASPVGITIIRQAILLYCNPAAALMFGVTSTKAQRDDSILTYIAPEFHAFVTERIIRRLQGEAVAGVIEVVGRRVDGSHFPMQVQTSQVLLPDGPAVIAFLTDITESKRAAEEREHSLAMLHATLESTADGILVLDLAGQALNFNQKFMEMWGIPTTVTLSQEIEQALDVAGEQVVDIVGYNNRVSEIFSQPDAHSFDEILFKDGRVFERYTQPVRINGKSMGRVASYRDITKHRQIEATLRQSEALLRATLESTADGILVVDQGEQIVNFNQKFVEMWDIPEEVLATGSNERTRNFILDQLADPTGFVARVRKAMELPDLDIFVEIRLKDGRIFERFVKPIRLGAQNMGRVMSFHDVTERRQAEDAVRQSEALLRGIIDNAPLTIFVKSLDGRYLLVNRQWEKLRSLTLNQIKGKTNYEFLEQALADRYYAWDQEVIRTGKVLEFEDYSTQINGAPISATIRALLCDPVGEPYAIIGIGTDITERRQLEEKLLQAQRLEAIGRFVGGVAHDFNNILTIIYSASTLARRRLGDEVRVGRYLDEIQNAGERAATLIQQMLAFSRKQVVQPRVLSLHVLLTGMEEMVKRLIGENIQVKLQLAPDLAAIQADPNQMEQIILNLAANARDAMPNGGVLLMSTENITHTPLSATGEQAAEPRLYVRLTIVDSGQGVDPVILPHIFEPFFTTKEAGKGTGLGLATVYGIVQQNGGEIQVESQLGWGTTVRILLPAVADLPQLPSASRPGGTAAVGGETVLLVEDQAGVRQTTSELLTESGYQVLVASSANEAFEIFVAHPNAIDLLLTDLVMPLMNGSELATHLRALQPSLKVLYMSGHTEDAEIVRGVRNEQVAFLQKPFTRNELLEKLHELLERNAGAIAP